MDEKRMGEIALALWRYQVKRSGTFPVGPRVNRDVGNLSKATGIPKEELMEFGKIVGQEIFQETYGK